MKYFVLLFSVIFVTAFTPIFAQSSSQPPKWLQVRKDWIKSDSGSHVLGNTNTALHRILGQPSLSFARSRRVSEDMWFSQNHIGYISVLYDKGRAIQVETELSPSGELMPGEEYLNLGKVKQRHANLSVSAYSYSLSKYFGENGHETEITRDEEMKHFQGNAVSYYYDDIANGIAFSFSVQDYFDNKIKIEKVIVHTSGVGVIPAIYGKLQKPTDEVSDASHPPGL